MTIYPPQKLQLHDDSSEVGVAGFFFAIDQIKLTLNESRRHFMHILLCCDMQRCVQFV